MEESITAELFFDGESLHPATRIVLDGARVVAIERHDGPCDHHLLVPGLVDLQMNGFLDVDCSRAGTAELVRLDAELALRGTTTWLATVVTAPLDRMTASIERIDAAIASGMVPGCAGIHLEGPFLGSVAGAHRPDWILPPDPEWVAGLSSSVRMVTVGAEHELSPALASALVDRGITVSVGHTRPTSARFDEMVLAGASMVTHLFNGMSGVHHRDDGLALTALLDDRVAVGLIGDLVHVSAAATRLAFRAKRGRGVVLVSDTIAWSSEWASARGVSVLDGAPRLADGTLAGSRTELAECVRRVHDAGVDLPSVLRAATLSPAETIGDTVSGRVREGARCDILAFDAELRLVPAACRLVFPRGTQTLP